MSSVKPAISSRGFVKKYKSFEEAHRDQFVFAPDEHYFRMVLLMHSMSLLKKIGRKTPKGVYKYKSFDDAQKDSLNWILTD